MQQQGESIRRGDDDDQISSDRERLERLLSTKGALEEIQLGQTVSRGSHSGGRRPGPKPKLGQVKGMKSARVQRRTTRVWLEAPRAKSCTRKKKPTKPVKPRRCRDHSNRWHAADTSMGLSSHHPGCCFVSTRVQRPGAFLRRPRLLGSSSSSAKPATPHTPVRKR